MEFGPALRIFMKSTSDQEIESDTGTTVLTWGQSILASYVTAGHEIENEAGVRPPPPPPPIKKIQPLFRTRDPLQSSSLRKTPGESTLD